MSCKPKKAKNIKKKINKIKSGARIKTDYRIGENLIKWYTSIALSFSMISQNVSMCMVKIVAVICSGFSSFSSIFFRSSLFAYCCDMVANVFVCECVCTVYALLHYNIVRMALYVYEG